MTDGLANMIGCGLGLALAWCSIPYYAKSLHWRFAHYSCVFMAGGFFAIGLRLLLR